MPQIGTFDKHRVFLWLLASKRVTGQLTKQDLIRNISTAFHLQSIKVIELKWRRDGDIFTVTLDVELEQNEANKENKNILNFKYEVSITVCNVSFTIFKATSRLLNCVKMQEYSPSQYTVIVRNNLCTIFIIASKIILRQN